MSDGGERALWSWAKNSHLFLEKFTIKNLNHIEPGKTLECEILGKNKIKKIELLCRIDTKQELEYYKAGGILQYVLNSIAYNAA